MWGSSSSDYNSKGNTKSRGSHGGRREEEELWMCGVVDPLQQLVMSMDCLCGQQYDQRVDEHWEELVSNHLLLGNVLFLKQKLLNGGSSIPLALRCAIWMTCVVRNCHPERPNIQDYGTLRKVRVLDHGWNVVLQEFELPILRHHPRLLPPLMGLTNDQMEELISSYPNMTKKGRHEWTQLLYAAQHVLGLEYCPLLPDISAILLSYMPVSYAYAIIREMATTTTTTDRNEHDCYFPTSPSQHLAWCQTFYHLLQQYHPQLATTIIHTTNTTTTTTTTKKKKNNNNRCAASSLSWLHPIFQTLFRNILKRTDVLHLFDLYMMKGSKVLFRVGLSLLGLCQPYLLQFQHQNRNFSFWKGIQRITHSSTFHFHIILHRCGITTTNNNHHHDNHYSNRRSRLIKRYSNNNNYPRHSHITKLIQQYESSNHQQTNALDNTNNNDMGTTKPDDTIRPLGLIKQKQDYDTNNKLPITIPVVLAKEAMDRINLKRWLPIPMQTTKLDIIYSSNIHGRSTEQFYKYCQHSKHTLTLMEVLKTGAKIGMYATHTWHADAKVYGDGDCFLFRLSPNPICYKWNCPQTDDLWKEQFIMISRHNFISMGIGDDSNGDSGLRLNEDLTIGTSNTAIGFNNEPLPGNNLSTFEIGLVEVYRFVREVDGKAIDNNHDTSWTFPT